MVEALILNITIDHQPEYARRLAVPAESDYEQLSAMIQLAFGWAEDSQWAFALPSDPNVKYVHYAYDGSDDLEHAQDAGMTAIRDELADASVQYTCGQQQLRVHQIAVQDVAVAPVCLAMRGDGATPASTTISGINAALSSWAAGEVFGELADDFDDDGNFADILPEAQQALVLQFMQAPEREAHAEVPDVLIDLDLTDLLVANAKPLDQWTQADWQAAIDQQLGQQGDAAPMMATIDIMFVNMLSHTKQLQVPEKVVLDMIKAAAKG